MKASKTLGALAVAVAVAGCDTSVGPGLGGLWIANTYVYRNDSGQTVDIIERDGASFSLTVTRGFDGGRVVTATFEDGAGGRETMSGEVSVDAGTFTFETVVFDYTRRNDELILVSSTPQAFDFGAGSEPATLTIRLTQL